ncbi:hypothetical protein BD408DRAFT_95974 [Parasitella parasitica]|nr:hypothetical protein BD408DRAFT_95974 [Parasitella parasitica]
MSRAGNSVGGVCLIYFQIENGNLFLVIPRQLRSRFQHRLPWLGWIIVLLDFSHRFFFFFSFLSVAKREIERATCIAKVYVCRIHLQDSESHHCLLAVVNTVSGSHLMRTHAEQSLG